VGCNDLPGTLSFVMALNFVNSGIIFDEIKLAPLETNGVDDGGLHTATTPFTSQPLHMKPFSNNLRLKTQVAANGSLQPQVQNNQVGKAGQPDPDADWVNFGSAIALTVAGGLEDNSIPGYHHAIRFVYTPSIASSNIRLEGYSENVSP